MEWFLDFTMLNLLALLVAFVSAIWAYLSSNEAKKANDIGRLNSLFAFRDYYIQKMKFESEFIKEVKGG